MLPPPLAGIKRTWAKKSVAPESCQTEDGQMFTVDCAGHGARVILGNRSVTGIRNTDHGIEVHWRCPCGTEGVELMGLLAESQVA
jgi:hypothetical protein